MNKHTTVRVLANDIIINIEILGAVTVSAYHEDLKLLTLPAKFQNREHQERTAQVRWGGGQPKGDKRGQGEGGLLSKRDVLFTNT